MPQKRRSPVMFDTIPEVSPQGALVKVVFAGANLNSTSSIHSKFFQDTASSTSSAGSTPVSSPSSVTNANFFGRNFPSPDLNNNPVIADTKRNCVLDKRKKLRRQNSKGLYWVLFPHNNNNNNNPNQGQTKSFSELDLIDSELIPSCQISGIIEGLGEEIEEAGNSTFCQGDKVVVYPFRSQPFAEYADILSVPDLRHLIRLPRDFPLDAASLIIHGAYHVFNVIEDVHHYVVQSESRGRIMILGSESILVTWAIRLIQHFFPADRVQIVVATDNDSLLAVKKHFPNVAGFVCWNKEAYEADMIERTKSSVKGGFEADLCLFLGEISPKHVKTSLKCMKKGGRIFTNADSTTLFPAHVLAAVESHNVAVTESLDPGSADTCREMIDLVHAGELQCPPFRHISIAESARVRQMMERGLFTGNALFKFATLK